MKRRLLGIVTLLLLVATTACSIQSTTTLSTTGLTTHSVTTTTTETTTTTTTQTTTTTMTTAPFETIVLDGMTGAGTEEDPYRAQIIWAESTSFALEIHPLGYVGTLLFAEAISTPYGFLPLEQSSDSSLDFSASTASEFVIEGQELGVYYVMIRIDDQFSVLIELEVVRRPITIDFSQSLKILAIGNSFSVDAMEYLYKIAKNYGITEVILGNLYIGGAGLDTHVNSFNANATNYTYYKNTNDAWTSQGARSLLYGLQNEDWDIITIQQVSGKSGRPTTYQPFLDQLITIVETNKTNPDAHLLWHMTWAYQQTSTHGDFVFYNNNQSVMFQAIVNTVSDVIRPRPEITMVIPAGTAIQNLRTSYIGDTLTVDGYHLSLTRGRYTAALTWFHAITGLSIDNITYKPATGVSDADLIAIKEAVKQAVLNPTVITPSSYPTLPA
jgi:hypothetical protein